MVHFKKRYMVMEVFIDVSRGEADPIILTQFKITKVIRDNIQLNFGELKYVNPLTKLCVIQVSREDHQKVWAAITMVRSIGIRACKKAALECEEAKFEQYKLAAGDSITPKIIESVQSCFGKLKGLDS
ncbi:hypothetical protein VPH35_047411 [Triticum aestivum]